jgi:hypothetical protein
MKNIKEYLDYIILVFCALTFLNTCSTKTTLKKVNSLTKQVDSLKTEIINRDEMIKIIQETPAWKTLRIEEISDKEKISINALEEKLNK